VAKISWLTVVTMRCKKIKIEDIGRPEDSAEVSNIRHCYEDKGTTPSSVNIQRNLLGVTKKTAVMSSKGTVYIVLIFGLSGDTHQNRSGRKGESSSKDA